MLNKRKKNLIKVAKVERIDLDKVKQKHMSYKNKKNVVRKEIKLLNLNSYLI
jgi:hypothetical protein